MVKKTHIDEEIDNELRKHLSELHDRTAEELQQARNVIGSYEDKASQLEAKLERIAERMQDAPKPEITPPIFGEGGRVKKGLSKKIITDYLKMSNGVGATIPQIVSDTGTKLSTVRRIIKELEQSKKVETRPDSRWRWNKTGELAEEIFQR